MSWILKLPDPVESEIKLVPDPKQIIQYPPGLRIRSIFGRLQIRILQIRILKLDPDPGSYWHLKNQFKHQNFFHIQHISSDNWMMIIFIWKMEKFTWKCVKALFLKYFFLVYTTLHCQSTDRIRIRWKLSGSGQKGPDPQPWLKRDSIVPRKCYR